MDKRKITPQELRELIKAEAAKDPLCEDLTKIELFGTEDGGGTWTASWHGLGHDTAANDAMVAIMKRLTSQYEVAWATKH